VTWTSRTLRYKGRGKNFVQSFYSPPPTPIVSTLIHPHSLNPLFTMQFFKIFSMALLPLMVLAGPAPSPVDDPVLAELTHMIEARQTSSLTSLLSALTGSIAGIEQLLSASSLNNIEAVVTDLADLLAAPTGNQTKSLIGTVSDLLGSTAVSGLLSELPTLLSSVSGLLTPQLITNVTDILGNAHDLLTAEFVSETKGLISDIAPVSQYEL
jgi:hypothetical protein